jgi:hypothetical protein
MARLFSCVVEHDEGRSPNPFGRYCTLAHCKFSGTGKRANIIELANDGDWVVGTGGANLRKSCGHGTIVYAMKVTDKLPLKEYLSARKFRGRVDCHDGPRSSKRFALISEDFYYFGRMAKPIPSRFNKPHRFEKRGPGFRSDFDEAFVDSFVSWLRTFFKRGRQGDPVRGIPTEQRLTCRCL